MFYEITTSTFRKYIINVFQIVSVCDHGETRVLVFSNGDQFRVTKEEFENNIKKLLESVSF